MNEDVHLIVLGAGTPGPYVEANPTRECDDDTSALVIVEWHRMDRPYCLNTTQLKNTFVMGPPGYCCPDCGWWAIV